MAAATTIADLRPLMRKAGLNARGGGEKIKTENEYKETHTNIEKRVKQSF